MTEFEKKTLAYALLWTWLFVFFPVRMFIDMTSRPNLVPGLFIAGGSLLVLCVLYSAFGLWKTAWSGGGYFREDGLTDREKLLSRQATSRALRAWPVFIIGSFSFMALLFAVTPHGPMKFSVPLMTLAAMAVLTFAWLAFLAAKSYVLFAFLLGERLQSVQKNE